MRTIISIVCLTAVSLLGCRSTARSAASIPLSFYIVSEEKGEGGRFIDTSDFPKLGYIAPAPDLVIARLESVARDVSRRQDTMVDKDGKKTVMPLEINPALNFRMRSLDAKKFTKMTEQAVGKQVLIMLGETPLIAPMVLNPITTQSLILTLGDKIDNKKIEDELKRLVR